MARMPSETFTLEVTGGMRPDGTKAKQWIDVSLTYGPKGKLHDVIFVGRGKIGQGLDLLLHDLGIQLSRAIQGRNPHDGL